MTKRHDYQFDERTLNGIGILVAVVRQGSFASAAASLHMSQPGVSRAIARLEARLGVRLLERTTRRLSLTEEGQRLHQQVMPLLLGLEEAALSVKEGNDTPRGRLCVHIDPYFSQLVLGPQLRAFLRRYPELGLELLSTPRATDAISDGYDLAIRFGEPRPSSLITRKLFDTRILTVASPAYLKRYGRPKTPEELETKGHIMIDFRNPDTGRPFEWVFLQKNKEISIQTNGQLLLNDVATMHSVCLAGYGIAQIMELGAEAYLENGRLVNLFPNYEERFPLYAYYPSKNLLPLKVRAFLDFVLQLTSSAR